MSSEASGRGSASEKSFRFRIIAGVLCVGVLLAAVIFALSFGKMGEEGSDSSARPSAVESGTKDAQGTATVPSGDVVDPTKTICTELFDQWLLSHCLLSYSYV